MEPTRLEVRIRGILGQWSLGHTSLADVEEELAQASWDVDPDVDARAADLLYSFELWLAEYSKGHRDEQELESLIGALLAQERLPAPCFLGPRDAREDDRMRPAVRAPLCERRSVLARKNERARPRVDLAGQARDHLARDGRA